MLSTNIAKCSRIDKLN